MTGGFSGGFLTCCLDRIPELVDAINLQPGGYAIATLWSPSHDSEPTLCLSPTEACRAIRKKLKYGDVHRQLRALTMLKALVENCGQKFQSMLVNP